MKASDIIVLIIFTSPLFGCKKILSKSTAADADKLAFVKGQWKSPCYSGDEGSHQTFYDFHGTYFLKKSVQYELPGCQKKNTTETVSGRLHVKNDLASLQNRLQLNLAVTEHSLAIHNDMVVSYFNNANVGNKSDWKKDSPESLTGHTTPDTPGLTGSHFTFCLEVQNSILRLGFAKAADREKCQLTEDLLQRTEDSLTL